jgi:hypothetical protein
MLLGSPSIGLQSSTELAQVGGVFLNATIPLFFELTMETVYPTVSQASASALLSVLLAPLARNLTAQII